MRNIYSVILSLVMLLSSCEKQQVIDKNPGNNPKVFLSGFVGSGDSSHYFLVGKSMPVFGSSDMESDTITDATVTLDDGKQQLVFFYDAVSGTYTSGTTSAFKILQGVPLRVSLSWQGQLLSALSVPPVASPYQMQITYDSLFAEGVVEFRIKLVVKNTGGRSIFLRAGGLAEDESLNSQALFTKSGTEIVAVEPGNTAIFELFTNANYFPNPDQTLKALVYLLQCSPEYYQYYESLRRRSIFSPGGDANIVYSNITNGLGIFATYTELEKQTIVLR